LRIVSDSSPLITLSKIGYLGLLPDLFHVVTITPEVYGEVVVTGEGLAGAAQILGADWIRVHAVSSSFSLSKAGSIHGLGIGELSAITLCRELNADLLLVDDRQARKLAREVGLSMAGCVGLLREGFVRNLVPDLSAAYRHLLAAGARVDRRLLESVLKDLRLPPL